MKAAIALLPVELEELALFVYDHDPAEGWQYLTYASAPLRKAE